MARRFRSVRAACAALALTASSGAAAQDAPPAERPSLAVMGTIPLVWGEAADLGELIGGGYQPHWARAVLERQWQLVPLDSLTAEALAGEALLLLAQPRGLAPQENVALDAWVRAGGRLLLLADPLMTGESRFGLGDRRRPQGTALLSPILAHWGLELQFDEQQPAIAEVREIAGARLPLNLPGRFALRGPAQGSCELGGEAVLARCSLGEGSVVLLADAALLDFSGPAEGAADALDWLTRLAFAQAGEITGTKSEEFAQTPFPEGSISPVDRSAEVSPPPD